MILEVFGLDQLTGILIINLYLFPQQTFKGNVRNISLMPIRYWYPYEGMPYGQDK